MQLDSPGVWAPALIPSCWRRPAVGRGPPAGPRVLSFLCLLPPFSYDCISALIIRAVLISRHVKHRSPTIPKQQAFGGGTSCWGEGEGGHYRWIRTTICIGKLKGTVRSDRSGRIGSAGEVPFQSYGFGQPQMKWNFLKFWSLIFLKSSKLLNTKIPL